MRRNERILLEVRDQYLWAKDVSYHRSGNSSYPSPSTLKGLAEAGLVLEAAKVSENARKRAFAFICKCSFLQCDGEHLAYGPGKCHRHLSVLHEIRGVSQLDDGGVAKVRLESGLKACL